MPLSIWRSSCCRAASAIRSPNPILATCPARSHECLRLIIGRVFRRCSPRRRSPGSSENSRLQNGAGPQPKRIVACIRAGSVGNFTSNRVGIILGALPRLIFRGGSGCLAAGNRIAHPGCGRSQRQIQEGWATAPPQIPQPTGKYRPWGGIGQGCGGMINSRHFSSCAPSGRGGSGLATSSWTAACAALENAREPGGLRKCCGGVRIGASRLNFTAPCIPAGRRPPDCLAEKRGPLKRLIDALLVGLNPFSRN